MVDGRHVRQHLAVEAPSFLRQVHMHLAPVGGLCLAPDQPLVVQPGERARGAGAVEHGVLGELGRQGSLTLGQERQDAPLTPGDAVVGLAQVHHHAPGRDVDAVEPVEQQVGLVLRVGEAVVGGHG
mgnify:CR=1 FL=1